MGKYIFKVHFLKTFNDGEVQVSQCTTKFLFLSEILRGTQKAPLIGAFFYAFKSDKALSLPNVHALVQLRLFLNDRFNVFLE